MVAFKISETSGVTYFQSFICPDQRVTFRSSESLRVDWTVAIKKPSYMRAFFINLNLCEENLNLLENER